MQPAAVRHTPESHNMLILLDQDNVLADFESGFRRHWRNRFGEDAPIEGKEHLFYIRDRLPEHLQAYAAELYGTVGFFESLPPVSGAVEAARALLAAGHDVRICTAPVNQYRYCAGEKIAWVEQHLGTEWTRRVIIAKDKTWVRGDILIDDKPNIEGTLPPLWQHRLYDAPHNRHLDVPRIVWTQPDTWADLLAG
ncbi:5' nucleotidase, NT5C type [Neisseria elongata]|uniref:5' nucleotidase, NT5C type n=2 Tax=Neisseria elongata TaxID=495 RepID=UPI0024B1715E|nr:5'-3'-deoxyribonucleotidase [Neisseria elongata]